MNCPRCQTPLIIVEYEDIELDWCSACGGLWFNRGEMDLLALKMGLPPVRFAPAPPGNARDEKMLKCPECNRRMDKRLLEEDHSTVVDVCPHCGGLWLDHGELEQVLCSHAAVARPDPITQHLRSTFADRPENHASRPA